MGKYSASGVEIIPIKDKSKSDSDNRMNSNKEMERIPYISDPTIVPRVQKYLESNVDKTYVDINVMADDLQQKYREYARRKRSAFRASVKKAYSIVLRSYGISDPDQEDSSSEEALTDDSNEEENKTNNSANSQLQDMYRRPAIPKQIDENELIDISSDDSEENAEPPTKKSNNGASSTTYPPAFLQQVLQTQNTVRKEIPQAKNEKTLPVTSMNDKGKKRKAEPYNVPPYQSAMKKKKSVAILHEPSVTFKDCGGMDKVLKQLTRLLLHIDYPEIYRHMGITPPRGFLLHGPPGSGKTLLANAIAGQLGIPLLKVAAPELVAGISGESEKLIRELFERAVSSSPCILFIDEIDAITPNRQNAQKEMERRIVAQLLSCLDDLNENENGDRVLVIGATNRPDAIDPALRRAGRFDREICLGIPDVQSREQILKVLTAKLNLSPDFDFPSLAKYTPGYVGADLMSLTREAALAAVERSLTILEQQWKLEQELAVKKAIEEKDSMAEKEKEAEKAANKSDPEIIVDDEVEVTEPDEASKSAAVVDTNSSDSAVVVIDDDVVKNPTAQAEAVVNGDKTEVVDSSVQEPMPVDVKPQSSFSSFEEILMLRNSKLPINDEMLASLYITMEDFGKALKCVQPSAKREGFITVPDVTWDDVGSLTDIRKALQMTILAPVRHAEHFAALGITTPTGVLLCGPPGCGKTLLAKAIANEAGINFMSVKGPELLNMYVGESERAVRVCFERARSSAPCVIFFDEIDALCPKRSDSREGGSAMRVVNQMLTEMDGIEGRQGVYILAASNKPEIIDPALLRPGRLDEILYVGLPTAVDRVDILRAITKNGTRPPLAADVDLEIIGKSEQCKGYTGADLAQLVKKAGLAALEEYLLLGNSDQPILVNTEHFNRAVTKIRPSVTEKDRKHYEKLRKLYSANPEENEVEEMEYS